MPLETPDTITAVATASGEAGLAIVRLSGSDALAIAGSIFKPSSRKKLSDIQPRRVQYGTVISRKGMIDRAMCTVMKGPRSYTGEDVVEITTHGSPVILRMIITEILHHGARLAEPGEFTRRAYLNGKIDLVQAEAVADLIRAKTDAAVQTAHKQRDGFLSKEIETIKESLVQLIANIEVRLDHPDEDIEPMARTSGLSVCTQAIKKIDILLKTAVRGRLIKEGINIAIIGKANVGKSSLLNALIQQERAIVTDEPGTTRDTVDAELVLEDIPVTIIDTAGIRQHALSQAERLGMERSKNAVQKADFLLTVFDVSEAFSDDDKTVIDYARTVPGIAVFNKIDRKPRIPHKKRKTLVKPLPLHAVSALTGEGIAKLREKIYAIISKQLPVIRSSVMITNVRHEQALERAQTALHKAAQAIKKHEPDECTAFELRQAIDALDELTGKTTDEDILNKIFTSFCVGK